METSVTIFGQQLKPSSCDDDGVAEFDVRDATCTVDKKLVTSEVGLTFSSTKMIWDQGNKTICKEL